MDTINIKQLAEFCLKEFQDNLDSIYKYAGTIYVAISIDNKVKISNTLQILNNAYRCILIIKTRRIDNSRIDYYVNYISELGCVTNGFLGNGFYLKTQYISQVLQYQLNLYHADYNIAFEINPPFEHQLQKLWDIYCKVKDVKSKEELLLLKRKIENKNGYSSIKAELDYAYQQLDELNAKYKKLLDSIKGLIE